MDKIRISLNASCPCRSGEKYKKCCMGKLSNNQEEYFGFLQYFNKIKDKLMIWFLKELTDKEKDDYAKAFGVKNIEVIMRQENPAEFFEWLFYEARDKETNEKILKIIIEKYSYLFSPDELFVLRERLNNALGGIFEVLESDEKSWKILLKEINTNETYEVMDRLGSLDSAIGDVLITRIEKVFSKYYLGGYGRRISRRDTNDLLLYIKNLQGRKKGENPNLEYNDFMNSNFKQVLEFKQRPTVLLANDGEELKLCEGKFRLREENIKVLIEYFHRNPNFYVTEEKYTRNKKYSATILLKKEGRKITDERSVQMLTSFVAGQSGEKIDYSGSIDIKENEIKIFSFSEKIYRGLVSRINNEIKDSLILMKEKLETAEEALKKSEKYKNKLRIDEKISNKTELEKEFLSSYYKKWCDEEILALENKTPRETMKTEEGKKLLKELLIDIKNMDEHKRKSGELNFSAEKFIRDELKFYE